MLGVTLEEKIARADRPYVFVKLETNQGVVGWGEATLEGKAGAAMACVNDLRDFIIGGDPMHIMRRRGRSKKRERSATRRGKRE